MKDLKGIYMGNCNRSSCLKQGANWYNYSTRMYYCYSCARILNDANRQDAQRLYGHDLCVEGNLKSK